MDKETSKWLAIISIVVAILIILFFLLSGFELSGFEIHMKNIYFTLDIGEKDVLKIIVNS